MHARKGTQQGDGNQKSLDVEQKTRKRLLSLFFMILTSFSCHSKQYQTCTVIVVGPRLPLESSLLFSRNVKQ